MIPKPPYRCKSCQKEMWSFLEVAEDWNGIIYCRECFSDPFRANLFLNPARNYHPKAAENLLKYLIATFPALADRMLDKCSYFTMKEGMIGGEQACFPMGQIAGFTSHPDTLSIGWFFSRGGVHFMSDNSVPSDFFALSLYIGINVEDVVAMWREGDRRFWFYDRYVVLVADSKGMLEQTTERIKTALERWDSGEYFVIFGIE